MNTGLCRPDTYHVQDFDLQNYNDKMWLKQHLSFFQQTHNYVVLQAHNKAVSLSIIFPVSFPFPPKIFLFLFFIFCFNFYDDVFNNKIRGDEFPSFFGHAQRILFCKFKNQDHNQLFVILQCMFQSLRLRYSYGTSHHIFPQNV